MGSNSVNEKPHAVCIPYPAQGHINPMLKVAKLLHQKGFHITFVNTEFNHKRLLKSRGPNSLDGLPSFRFETIPDGLPPTDVDATQDIPLLCESTSKTGLAPFKQLLSKLNESGDVPPISCIVSDGVMSFTVDAAEELGIPEILFWTTSACGFLAYLHYRDLVDKGYIPFKDPNYLTNGELDTIIDWIPGMNNIRLKDIPSFIRTTNLDDIMLQFVIVETNRAKRASAIILNTFDALEHQSITSLSTLLPPIFPIGPLNLLSTQITDKDLKQMGSNLWAEEAECLDWLDTKKPNSVVYVNFGSITVMTKDQLIEFAWGLANSKKTFLWVIRPDLVSGESAILPSGFLSETKDRGLLANWCPQEQVLHHRSVGGFLTHSGWNSTIESISCGVPMVCWPFFAEQQTNCRYCCVEWGVGMEIDSHVTRGEVERLVLELMDGGDEGLRMRAKAMEWKELAQEAVAGPKGSSFRNLDTVINEVLLKQNPN